MTEKKDNGISGERAAAIRAIDVAIDAAPSIPSGFAINTDTAHLRGEIAPVALTVMEELANVKNSADFLRCTEGTLQQLIPHEVTFASIGTNTEHGPRALNFLGHQYPWEFLTEIQGVNGEIQCSLFDRWLATGEPQTFDIEHDAHRMNKKWLAAFRKYDFRKFINHGVRARSRDGVTSYFVFARICGSLKPEYVEVMKLIAPPVHVALLRAFSVSEQPNVRAVGPENPLTERQGEILRWIHQGKTNWEIAQILGFTEKAVKYHLAQIFQKLQVTNRTQAVVKAVALKIIQ